MDQLLGSTAFDQVYQVDSPWFGNKSAQSTATGHLTESTLGEHQSGAHLSRQHAPSRQSSDNRGRRSQDDTVESADESKHSYVRHCAQTFLSTSALTSHEQGLFLPIARSGHFEDRNRRADSCPRSVEATAGTFGHSFDSEPPSYHERTVRNPAGRDAVRVGSAGQNKKRRLSLSPSSFNSLMHDMGGETMSAGDGAGLGREGDHEHLFPGITGDLELDLGLEKDTLARL